MDLAGEEQALPGLRTQDTLYMNEYLSGLKPRYVFETGQVLSFAASLRPHPVMGPMIMMRMKQESRVLSYSLITRKFKEDIPLT